MKRDEGLSILEVIISLGVFSLILVVISSLQLTIFTQNRLSEARASIDQRSLIVLRNFATEVRAAQTPYDGSFVLADTTADTVSFYADINGDDVIERVRYAVEGGILKRGVIAPTGQPLSYDPANESVASLIQNVVTAAPYFIYYGTSFDGSTSTPALTQPVSPADVRLVELHLQIDTKVRNQEFRTLETRAMIRSLKNK
ncbi:MAG: hypothetical protein A3B30_00985 [Candidatus Komeilibacteria bacterium RIFCSPLOWO2_01_FULL_52_15]|uniref:Uncharacterized protein n=1 Tax=Candidatus Komeilibacteria bacterium RIFCSPLOWO2_01_FULL_52_15 TaxID=1798551 RepID=A0A1G2BS72_9BACT|nr:MAG: hypothetical protein A3B30_00985 [Candidatus Komeilibacteria bacterium RIFCSPLOWO2_01_FULL_52_15]